MKYTEWASWLFRVCGANHFASHRLYCAIYWVKFDHVFVVYSTKLQRPLKMYLRCTAKSVLKQILKIVTLILVIVITSFLTECNICFLEFCWLVTQNVVSLTHVRYSSVYTLYCRCICCTTCWECFLLVLPLHLQRNYLNIRNVLICKSVNLLLILVGTAFKSSCLHS